MIEQWAESEKLDEFETAWSKFREMTREGISRYPDHEVRDLFMRLSIISAHAEMRVAIAESVKDRKKLEVELEQSLLLQQYKNGAMNKRIADVQGDEEYKTTLREYNNAEDHLTITKGQARAASIAAAALSREISARLKQ